MLYMLIHKNMLYANPWYSVGIYSNLPDPGFTEPIQQSYATALQRCVNLHSIDSGIDIHVCGVIVLWTDSKKIKILFVKEI